MASFNKVILMGNLTKDPELRQTQRGTSVCKFSIAVNESYTTADGSRADKACFIEIDSYGKTAENIARFFSRGKPILLEGRLKMDSWEDKDTGKNRSKLSVTLDKFEFVGGKTSSDDEGDRGYRDTGAPRDYPTTSTSQQADVSSDLEDDDVPF